MNLINDEATWQEAHAILSQDTTEPVAIDIETTGGELGGLFVGDRITGFAIAVDGWTGYVPVRHVGSQNLRPDRARVLVEAVAWHDVVLMHNSPFDRAGLALEFRVEFRDDQVYDTMTGDWVINENLHHGLKEIGERLFGVDAKAEKQALKELINGETVSDVYDELRLEYLEANDLQRLTPGTPARLKAQAKVRAESSKKTWATLTAEDIADYAEQDVRLTLDLYRYQRQFFADNPEYEPAVAREMRVDGVMYRLNMTGVQVDWDKVEEGYSLALREAERLATLFPDVNLRSTKQVQALVYDTWKLPCTRHTGLGARSTDKVALAGLEYDDRVAQLVQFRKVAKMIDGYYLPMFLQRAKDDRIHPSFSSHRTVTGRASCSRPNLQTIPKEDEDYGDRYGVDWKGMLRSVFTAAPGLTLYSSDLPTAELRVAAIIAAEPGWLATIAAGGDLHQMMADAAGIRRAEAKTLNFSALYGVGAKRLADTLGTQARRKVTLTEARGILRRFWAAIPNIDRLYKGLSESWIRRRRVPIRPWAGRFRHIDGKFGPEPGYKALNAVIQGSIAEGVKDWMLELERVLPASCRLVLMVHDSVVIEGPPGMRDVLEPLIQAAWDKVNPFTELAWPIDTKEGSL